MIPFQALYDKLVPAILHYQIGSTPVNEVDQQLTNQDQLLKQLKINLPAARNRMQQMTIKKRRDVELNKGDWVFLKLQPYRQQTAFKRAFQKLTGKYYGPNQIMQQVGLQLTSSNCQKESVFTWSSVFPCSNINWGSW